MFEPHEIKWDEGNASRFWNYRAVVKSQENTYFSKLVGSSIVDWVGKKIPLKGEILDFGCGPGYLLEELIKRGIACNGADSSEASLEAVKEKFKNDPFFKGGYLIRDFPSPVADNAFDVVFLIETIEHFGMDEVKKLLSEMGRIVRKNGFLIITTPNDEDLGFKKIICPECGCIFHRVQHVSSWNKETLSSILREFGFSSKAFEETILLPKYIFPGSFYTMIFKFLHYIGIGKKIIESLPYGTGNKLPNLMFIGRKD